MFRLLLLWFSIASYNFLQHLSVSQLIQFSQMKIVKKCLIYDIRCNDHHLIFPD